MAETYTSEDFERASKARGWPVDRYEDVVLAALRIAAAITRPGVIEAALRRQDMSGFVIPQNAAAIRLALVKDSSNG